MLNNENFESILKTYHPDLTLRVNNGLTNIQQLRFRGISLGGVPRNLFYLDDKFLGTSLAYRGLKSIAGSLYKYENIRLSAHKSFNWLLDQFGIHGYDRAMTWAKVTMDPEAFGFSVPEYRFHLRLDDLGIFGTNRRELLRLLNSENETYDIAESKLKLYIHEMGCR